MEIVPPPVTTPVPPARQWWTWALFAVLAAFFIGTNVYSIFTQSSEVKDVIGTEKLAAPLALKQYAVFEEMSTWEGGAPFKSMQKTALEPSVSGFKAKIGESEEAAAWVLALETIQGTDLDSKALDKLLLSSKEEWVDVGMAYSGELKGAAEIQGDEVPQKVARWKAENPEANQIPFGELGIEANPVMFLGMFGWMGFVLFGGFITLVAYGVMKMAGMLKPKGYQINLSLIGFDARGARMSFYFATFLVLSMAAGVITVAFPQVDIVTANAGVFLVLICLTPIFTTFPFFGEKISWGEIIGDRSKLMAKVGWGFCGYMANFPLALAVTFVTSALIGDKVPTPSHELLEMIGGSGPVAAFMLYFMAAVAAPLIEEPMFRGVLFPAFQKVMKSPTSAIILSGLIFAVIHPQGPLLWPALACIGITAAVLTRQTGSLIPAILMHFLHNSTIYGINLVIR